MELDSPQVFQAGHVHFQDCTVQEGNRVQGAALCIYPAMKVDSGNSGISTISDIQTATYKLPVRLEIFRNAMINQQIP